MIRVSVPTGEAPAIRDGRTTVLVRLDEDWRLVSPGDRLRLVDGDGAELGTTAVTQIARMTAATAQGYLNAHDGHRRYLSRESFFETLRDRSTDSSIAPSTWLHVVEFEPIAGDRSHGGDRVIRTDGGVPAALTGRNGFRRDLLLALALLERERDGRISGSAIQERVEGLLDKPVNHGRLYENLDRLADRGLIEKVPEGIDRRTNAYRLTSAGRAALETRLERLADAVGADVRHPVEADGGGA